MRWRRLLSISVIASMLSTPFNAFISAPDSHGGTYGAITAPLSVSQSSSSSGVTLSWNAPSSGTPTSYTIEYSTTGSSWTTAGSTSGSVRTLTVLSGLAANTNYYFRVAAITSGVQGPYGYPWEEIYRTTTQNRNAFGNINYVSGFRPRNEASGDAAGTYATNYGSQSFLRIRYRLATVINSVSGYADVDFNKWTSGDRNTATGSNWDPDIDSIRIPSVNSPSAYTVHANINDMTINTNSSEVRNGHGISGRLELWPWNYGTGRSGLLPEGNTSTYDYDDVPAGSANYGSFQVHTLEDLEPVFVWNRHSNGQNAEVGYGARSTGNPDWTFCADGGSNVCTPTSFQLSIFVNPPVRTASTLAPVNTAIPNISGIRTFNETLTATNGTWSNTPTSYAYQWSRSSTSNGTFSNISGATSASYRLVAADVGQYLRFTVTATNAGGSNSATSASTTQISKATPTFSSWSNVTKTFGDLPYSVAPPTVTGSLAGSFSYSSSNTSVISISGSTFTVAGVGSATITANFTPTDSANYSTATTTQVVTVSKASQTITFDPLPPRTLGMGPFALSASASSGLSVSFASSNGSICSISDTSLALVSAGTCTITASQAGNTNYDSATSISHSFLISSSLLITTPSSGLSATYDAAYSLSLSTSGGSGGNTFALASGSLPPGLSLNTSSGVISGTPTSAGSSSLAIRVTDSNTSTATTSSFTIAVEKADPLLSSFTLPAKTYGDAPFTLTAPSVTGSIPGSFSYLSDSASVATILGNSVTITGAGSATLTALFTPTDTDNYETATITALLTVAKASQSTLTITSTTIPYGQSLSLTTSGGSGTGALTFVVNTGNCSITTATLTSTSTGTCSVTATKAADTNYLAESTTATITITTGSATATIAFSSTTLTFGVSNPITVTVSTAGSVRFSANGRVIKNCKARATTPVLIMMSGNSGSHQATCSYRPATRRPLTITARLTPTDLNIAPRTSTSAEFLVQRRTGVRG